MFLNKAHLCAASLGLALLSTTPLQAATLLADTVTVAYDFTSGSIGPTNIVVGSGVELTCGYSQPGCFGFNFMSLDIGANTISFKQLATESRTLFNYAFNGWRFTGLDFGAGIAGVTLTSGGPNDMLGLTQSDVSFTSNSISVNLAGVTPLHGWWTLTLQEAAPAPVPLPASLPLFAIAVGSLAAIRRRRGNRA
jgi:hypothetical protein